MPEVVFTGPAGRLEGRYQHQKKSGSPIAIILHPHPNGGGNMNNRIVYDLFHTFERRGFSVLRFNFRGVGRSQGAFDRGEGELSDAAAGLDWLQQVNPNASAIWVSGFSFGAWISMQLLMRRPEIDRFIVCAPPADMYDFGFLAPCPSSGLILQGDQDEIVAEPAVKKLAAKIAAQRGLDIDYRVLQGANHFFSNHVDPLMTNVEDYLRKHQPVIAEEVAV